MKIDKLRNIVSDALQSRGYCEAEAQQFIEQLVSNSEKGATETLPGSGIFCPEDKQLKCAASFRRQINEYERLWRTWMDRCHDLRNYLQEAVRPFNKKIKEIDIYHDKDKNL